MPKESPSLLRRFKLAPVQEPQPVVAMAALTATELQAMARRRLMGSCVLLAVAVLVSAVLFETEPPPLPTATRFEPVQQAQAPVPPAPAAPPALITETAAEAGREIPAPAAMPPASAPALAVPGRASAAAAKPLDPALAGRASSPLPPVRSAATAAASTAPAPRAMASAAAPRNPESVSTPEPKVAVTRRYAVQVGAFTDPQAVSEVRAKAAMAGFPVRAQEVTTAGGRRVRVRTRAFETREDAERAVARLKAAGLPTSVVGL